jgi:23S rRNA U2552 (ribose-2'-O)-methylase RlmE/FtsJ
MIEILNVMRFFETKTRVVKLRSLHLCEGPGGFIEALYYKAEQVKKSISCALGMTLKSNHQMIPGWRKATNFLQKNPSIKLIYGSTNTGDIYDPENQEYLKDLCKGKPVYLVTADGGFDFSDDFHAQERMIFRLLVSSSIIALQTLANDGDFVLKIFDIQSQTTRDFLTLIGSCFKEWTIYKPVTSRPCNSEWYFIGLAACFNRSKVIDYLLYIRDCLERDQTFGSLLEHNVKEEFLQILQKERVERQSLALQNVLKYCDEPRSLDKNIELWKQQIEPSKNWCNIFKIPCIF